MMQVSRMRAQQGTLCLRGDCDARLGIGRGGALMIGLTFRGGWGVSLRDGDRFFGGVTGFGGARLWRAILCMRVFGEEGGGGGQQSNGEHTSSELAIDKQWRLCKLEKQVKLRI